MFAECLFLPAFPLLLGTVQRQDCTYTGHSGTMGSGVVSVDTHARHRLDPRLPPFHLRSIPPKEHLRLGSQEWFHLPTPKSVVVSLTSIISITVSKGIGTDTRWDTRLVLWGDGGYCYVIVLTFSRVSCKLNCEFKTRTLVVPGVYPSLKKSQGIGFPPTKFCPRGTTTESQLNLTKCPFSSHPLDGSVYPP